jgi:hypothetical protein
MNRRSFIESVTAAFGVALVPWEPKTPAPNVPAQLVPEDVPVKVGQLVDSITVPIVLLNAAGQVVLRNDAVPFQVWQDRDAYGSEFTLFQATEDPVWRAVPAPLEVHQVAALIPFGELMHRVVFPISGPVYANGGDICIANLRAVLR